MRSQSKRTIGVSLLGIALVFALAELPGSAKAATIDFNDPLTLTNGYRVEDNEINPWVTSLYIEFTGVTGIRLAMDAGPLSPDERFGFRMQNASGSSVDRLWLQFIKPEYSQFTNTPSAVDWYSSLSHIRHAIRVDPEGIRITETEHAVTAELPLLEGFEWSSGEELTFFVYWPGFNTPRADWLLNIDWNKLDSDRLGLAGVPLPPALWLFLSGLFYLSAIAYRKPTAFFRL